MKTIQELLSFNLRSLRGDRTQEQIAEAAGIPFRTYQDCERGIKLPQQPTLESLAKLYGVSQLAFFQDVNAGKILAQKLNSIRAADAVNILVNTFSKYGDIIESLETAEQGADVAVREVLAALQPSQALVKKRKKEA